MDRNESNEMSLSPLARRLISIIEWRLPNRGRFARIAELTGTSKSAWSAVNSGRNEPGGTTLEAVCKIYPEYAYWLMTGQTDPDHGHTSPDIEQLEELRIRVGK